MSLEDDRWCIVNNNIAVCLWYRAGIFLKWLKKR